MSATGLRRKLALVAGGTLVGLLLAEVLLRLAAPQPTGVLALVNDPDLLVANEPDASGFVSIPGIYRHTFSHDAEGRRRTTSPGPGPEVMILGDSFAYGMGVDDDETVASRLGEVLRQRGMPVTVTDAGVPGVGSPVHALRLLQTHGAVWRPDVAVFLFYPNDFANVWWQSYYEVTPDSILPRRPTDLNSTRRTAIMSHPLFRYVRAHSHLSGLLWQFAVDHIGQNPPPSADTDTTRAPVPWSFPEAEAPMLRFLTALRDELAARGTPMILAYAPTASEVAQYRRQPGMSVDGARVAIHHRVGKLEVGEPAVIIAASAPHRAEAFEACRAAIERLKQDVPIWKREVSVSGASWIGQGP